MAYEPGVTIDCSKDKNDPSRVQLVALTLEEETQRDTERADSEQAALDAAALEQERQQRRAALRAALDGGTLSLSDMPNIVREVLRD